MTNLKRTEKNVEFLNEELKGKNINKKMIITRQASCYTFNKGLIMVTPDTDDDNNDWYYHGMKKDTFKTWSEALEFVRGVRRSINLFL